MKLFRIGPEQYLENYSGMGASYHNGARWNLPHQPVIYFATSQAVAILEMTHYLPAPHLVPPSYRLAEYALPDSINIQSLSKNELPENWRKFPHPSNTQHIGGAFLKACQCLGLLVPSTTTPSATELEIVVFNPRHQDASQLTLVNVEKQIFSERMFGKH